MPELVGVNQPARPPAKKFHIVLPRQFLLVPLPVGVTHITTSGFAENQITKHVVRNNHLEANALGRNSCDLTGLLTESASPQPVTPVLAVVAARGLMV
jgi:hypothetical protein